MRTLLTAGALLACAGVARAHVVLSPSTAAAGGYYAGELRVSHGCDGSPTTAVRVEISPGVISAKPQPKPGWTIQMEREPLPAPVPGEGGRMIRERVRAITWRGRLPDDEFDTFGLMLRPPAAPGPLPIPVRQTCETGSTDWVETATSGAPAPAHPAPVLRLEAPAPTAEHAHAH